MGGQGEVVLKLQKNLLELSQEAYVITSGVNIPGYPNTLRTGGNKRLFYATSAAFLNWIRRMNFDVINVHLDSGMSLVPLLAASKCRAKIVTTLHISYLCEQHYIERLSGFCKQHANPSLDEYLVKYVLTPVKFLGTYIDCACSDRIVAVSKRTRDECSADYGIPGEKISVIYNGVDLDEFNPQLTRSRIRNKLSLGENPVVLAVGTATIRKGVQYLLRSMLDVTGKLPEARLIVVGSRRYYDQLQSLADYLGIQKRVIFLGPVAREELPFYYAACDVVAVPSTYEAFPVVVLEALASGKPVVASRVGGIPEAIEPGRNGILVDPGDTRQLSDALLTILSDDHIRDGMGRVARLDAESKYDWKKIADRYVAEFKSLL